MGIAIDGDWGYRLTMTVGKGDGDPYVNDPYQEEANSKLPLKSEVSNTKSLL